MTKKFNELLREFKSKEDGNVESALVLIPLLILFLVGLELIVATNLRNAEVSMAQSDASTRAISGEFLATDQIIELDSLDPFLHMKVLITSRSRTLPQLVPGLLDLLSGKTMIQVKGAAIVEEVN